MGEADFLQGSGLSTREGKAARAPEVAGSPSGRGGARAASAASSLGWSALQGVAAFGSKPSILHGSGWDSEVVSMCTLISRDPTETHVAFSPSVLSGAVPERQWQLRYLLADDLGHASEK